MFGLAGLTEGPKTTLIGIAMILLTLLILTDKVSVRELVEALNGLAPLLTGATGAGLLLYKGKP